MPARKGMRVCTAPGCGILTRGGRCSDCDQTADKARGNATERGYDAAHRAFRAKVLRRDKQCVLCRAAAATDPTYAVRASTDADHWPVDRRTLELRGENPNDPKHGRALCGTCHKSETARLQPGGFNQAS